jgi:putative FmdB family regulatory protein
VPVYDYSCVKGHRFEVFQSMSDTPLKKCEECGAKAERVLHAPAIHFKGSGFHNTDYGTKTRPVGGGSAGDSSGGEKKSGSDSTAAPATSGGDSAPKSSGKTVGLDKV